MSILPNIGTHHNIVQDDGFKVLISHRRDREHGYLSKSPLSIHIYVQTTKHISHIAVSQRVKRKKTDYPIYHNVLLTTINV